MTLAKRIQFLADHIQLVKDGDLYKIKISEHEGNWIPDVLSAVRESLSEDIDFIIYDMIRTLEDLADEADPAQANSQNYYQRGIHQWLHTKFTPREELDRWLLATKSGPVAKQVGQQLPDEALAIYYRKHVKYLAGKLLDLLASQTIVI